MTIKLSFNSSRRSLQPLPGAVLAVGAMLIAADITAAEKPQHTQGEYPPFNQQMCTALPAPLLPANWVGKTLLTPFDGSELKHARVAYSHSTEIGIMRVTTKRG